MKMLSAGTAAANQYTSYVHNCTRNAACELPYTAPVPSVGELQLFADFGATQPSSIQFTIIDTCNGGTEQIFPSEFVVGQTPEENWYGVFRGFNNPVGDTSFVVHLSINGGAMAFFSQMFSTEPCGPLMKIKSCHAEAATTTAFDVNGIYYGMPEGASAGSEITYLHTAWVRQGKVRELNDKATFKSNLYFNARTTVEKIHQIQTELVPKWYKDVLLAIYSRGMVQINDGQIYLVSDLNFEALNDDDLLWKPQAQLKETFRLFFGCDEFCITDSEEVPPDESEPGSEPAPSESEPPPDNVIIINGAGGYIIHSVTNIDGFTLSGDLTTGNQDSGLHTKNNGSAICVNFTVGGVAAHLSLIVNNITVQCIPDVNLTGSNCFNGFSIDPTDNIRVELIVGATC